MFPESTVKPVLSDHIKQNIFWLFRQVVAYVESHVLFTISYMHNVTDLTVKIFEGSKLLLVLYKIGVIPIVLGQLNPSTYEKTKIHVILIHKCLKPEDH